MKTIDNTLYFTITEAADILNISAQTVKNWYKWRQMLEEAMDKDAVELEEYKKAASLLPEPIQTLDERQTRYFIADSVEQLRAFQGLVHYGMMADYNRTRWGKRGKKKTT
jgi:hypothetical protein